MIELERLPEINAVLNTTSTVLLAAGYFLIRQRSITAHKACMLSAFATSTLFLACYLVHHFRVGHKVFHGTGAILGIYLVILVSHILLAVLVLPLSLTTIYRAFRQQFEQHKRIARWTLPIWLYVSVTGVVVYLMLYRMYPSR